MKILVINGPNLNMLGLREKEHYGSITLKEINQELRRRYKKISFFTSNYEGKIVTKIQKAIFKYDAIIINAGAYTHTSIAILDALKLFKGLICEVHLSDIESREEYRCNSYISEVADRRFIGKRENSYYEALAFILSSNKQ